MEVSDEVKYFLKDKVLANYKSKMTEGVFQVACNNTISGR